MSRLRTESRSIAEALDIVSLYIPSILSIWYFPKLVDDPIITLTKLLPLTIFTTILPRFFDTYTTVASTIYSLGILFAIFMPGVYVLVVLMGAPFTTHFRQTALFSAHLATMMSYTAITRFGLDRQRWIPLLLAFEETETTTPKQSEPQRKFGRTGLEGIFWGTLAGAYLGAVPIPLDWDRDWQKWPVTVHLGACLGLAMGGTLQILYNVILKPEKSRTIIKKRN